MQKKIILALFLGGALIALSIAASNSSYLFVSNGEGLLSQLAGTSGITAESFLIEDTETGQVLYERNPDTELPIASITKLFTAHVTNQSPLVDEETLIVWQDVVTDGTAGRLGLGETYTLRELLFPLLLSSSNDAAVAIYRKLGPTDFATSLQSVYEDAGLSQTRIVDASGLSGQNQSTAKELVRYLSYLEESDSYVLDITSLESYLGPYGGWINNNPAREKDTYRGGKHGYLPVAGRTFAGLFEKDGREYAVVLLGSDDLRGDIDAAYALLP